MNKTFNGVLALLILDVAEEQPRRLWNKNELLSHIADIHYASCDEASSERKDTS